jgi:phosphatidylserine/phosphatidylglycerophosphate/cardiolipin synthase-like enzyme
MLAWSSTGMIPDCRGFALMREDSKAPGAPKQDFVQSWVGFKGEKHKEGEHRSTEEWPVQRYVWTDLLADRGDKLRYRIIPMLRKTAGGLLEPAPEPTWSVWSDVVEVGTAQTKGFEAYFNRGIVPGQFLARQKANKSLITKAITTAGSPNRVFLGGELLANLLRLLNAAYIAGDEIYLALYELRDDELQKQLARFSKRCHLVLGNGSFNASKPDPNKDGRKAMRDAGVDLHNRMVTGKHFAHNKFITFCNAKKRTAGNADGAYAVWTGSTNWTETGLCTQVNNGIYIPSEDLARGYLARWKALMAAKDGYPSSLITQGSTPTKTAMSGADLTAWQVPCAKEVDLSSARKLIAGAKQGVLYLTFNPGPRNTLLNAITALDPEKLYIHGVANQEPASGSTPVLRLTRHGKKYPPVALYDVLPKPLQEIKSSWFLPEPFYAAVMIHSKVVVIDPFGAHPVVMTGSHNLGPKASGKNDDNLLVIENAPGIAGEYAINIAFLFAHYQWRYNQFLRQYPSGKKPKEKAKKKVVQVTYDGNPDDTSWQTYWAQPLQQREIAFWRGA